MAKKTTNKPMPLDTGEWLSPRMRVLPPDVRGLWVDLLCCMWESSERGVMVKSNQVAHTKQEIIRMIGVDATGSDAWLDLLVENGFCAVRESDGAYYSRHIVREENIRAKRREAGKKGGEITKAKIFSGDAEKPVAPVVPVPVKVEKPPETPPPTDQQQKKTEKVKKKNYAEFVTLTDDEYKKLVDKYTEPAAKRMIEILDNYKGSKGKKYKSDYRTILNWVVDRYYEEVNKNGTRWIQTYGGKYNTSNKAVPGGTQYANQSTGEHGDMETPKDYSQRF